MNPFRMIFHNRSYQSRKCPYLRPHWDHTSPSMQSVNHSHISSRMFLKSNVSLIKAIYSIFNQLTSIIRSLNGNKLNLLSNIPWMITTGLYEDITVIGITLRISRRTNSTKMVVTETLRSFILRLFILD